MSVPPTPRPPGSFALALAGAALVLLLQALPDIAPALEYRREALLVEPWRLITAHLVHVNWTHALVNAGAWLVLARLFERQLGAGRQLLCIAFGATTISLALAAVYPSIAWYRGASGALHALFFAGATAELVSALRRPSRSGLLLAAALLAGGSIKVALELPQGASTPYAAWLGAATVPQAHFIGALCGTLLGLLLAAQRPGSTAVSR